MTEQSNSTPETDLASQSNPIGSAPTAAVLIIGNEILSGRTQDTNLAYMAKGLASRGIRLRESRVIPDDHAVIVDTIRTLSSTYTYVFTTGGIGPTHDDITADCVADAFNVALDIHPDAESRLLAYFAEREVEPNADRLRMARVPAGGTLIDNPISAAPGFRLENVHVMAGVPRIMQAMFDSVLPGLQGGAVIESISVLCDLGEGAIAAPLRALQAVYPNVDLGSYPGKMPGSNNKKFSVTLVARSDNKDDLQTVKQALIGLVEKAGGMPEEV